MQQAASAPCNTGAHAQHRQYLVSPSSNQCSVNQHPPLLQGSSFLHGARGVPWPCSLCAAGCRAGLTVPFAVRALIERYREPEVKHPPTVKEVRQQCTWQGDSR